MAIATMEPIQKTSQAALITRALRDPMESQRVIEENHLLDEPELPRDLSPEDMQQIIGHMNTILAPFTTHISFSVHQETGKVVIVVMDSQTHEIIRQIPREEMLRLMARMRGMRGMLVNQKT